MSSTDSNECWCAHPAVALTPGWLTVGATAYSVRHVVSVTLTVDKPSSVDYHRRFTKNEETRNHRIWREFSESPIQQDRSRLRRFPDCTEIGHFTELLEKYGTPDDRQYFSPCLVATVELCTGKVIFTRVEDRESFLACVTLAVP